MQPLARHILLLGAMTIAAGTLRAQPAQAPVAPAATADAGQGQAGTTNQEVHLLVGHSVFIRTDSRLKRVLVGNPSVLTTSTTSPNEVVVTALAPGASSLMLWQEDGQSRLLETFADIDVTGLREALRRSMPNETVDVEADEDKLVLTGLVSSQAISDQVNKMALVFAKSTVNSLQIKIPGRQKEVLLKVRFAEVDRKRLESYGLNLFSTGGANTVGSSSTQQFGAVGPNTNGSGSGNSPLSINSLLNLFVFRTDLNFGAILADLQQRNILQMLAEPNLLAVSGSPARFLAGGEVPYPVVSGAGLGNQATVTIQFKPYGVKLEFTGDVGDDGMIRLTVAPEVSSLDYGNAVTISGFVMPAISTRRAETVVELKSGQSFGIAGLLDERTTAQLSKMPGFGDIPILGAFFKSKATNRSTTELMVFVTPQIVDPLNPGATPQANPEAPKMPIENGVPKGFDQSIQPKGTQ
jgi:pilus assembly protein CpaC